MTTTAIDATPAQRARALWLSTFAFAVCFAVWVIFSIIGVEPALYPSLSAEFKGEEARVGGATIAEGIAVKKVGRLTAEMCRRMMDDVVLVSEDDLERAVLMEAVSGVAAGRDSVQGLLRVRGVGPPEHDREVLIRHRVQVPPLQFDQGLHRRREVSGKAEPGQVLHHRLGYRQRRHGPDRPIVPGSAVSTYMC